jgi:hypothetical protein
MTNSDQAVKTAVARYRAMRSLTLLRALGFTLVGVVGLALAASGSIFDTSQGGQPTGWLYENLGREGAQAAAVGLMVLVIVIGLIWSYRVIRDITSGYKHYEEQIRRDLESGVQVR